MPASKTFYPASEPEYVTVNDNHVAILVDGWLYRYPFAELAKVDVVYHGPIGPARYQARIFTWNNVGGLDEVELGTYTSIAAAADLCATILGNKALLDGDAT